MPGWAETVTARLRAGTTAASGKCSSRAVPMHPLNPPPPPRLHRRDAPRSDRRTIRPTGRVRSSWSTSIPWLGSGSGACWVGNRTWKFAAGPTPWRRRWKRLPGTSPTSIITELTLRERHGAEVVRLIKSRFAKVPLLVFSALPEEMCAEAAIQAGAHGYLSKREPGATLMLAIRRVLAGEMFVSPRVAEALLQTLKGGQVPRRRSPLVCSARASWTSSAGWAWATSPRRSRWS